MVNAKVARNQKECNRQCTSKNLYKNLSATLVLIIIK